MSDKGKDTGGETPAVTLPHKDNSVKTPVKENPQKPQDTSGTESEKQKKQETREQQETGAGAVQAIREEGGKQQAATVGNSVLNNDSAKKREDKLTPANPKPDPDNQPDKPKEPEPKPV